MSDIKLKDEVVFVTEGDDTNWFSAIPRDKVKEFIRLLKEDVIKKATNSLGLTDALSYGSVLDIINYRAGFYVQANSMNDKLAYPNGHKGEFK